MRLLKVTSFAALHMGNFLPKHEFQFRREAAPK